MWGLLCSWHFRAATLLALTWLSALVPALVLCISPSQPSSGCRNVGGVDLGSCSPFQVDKPWAQVPYNLTTHTVSGS